MKLWNFVTHENGPPNRGSYFPSTDSLLFLMKLPMSGGEVTNGLRLVRCSTPALLPHQQTTKGRPGGRPYLFERLDLCQNVVASLKETLRGSP